MKTLNVVFSVSAAALITACATTSDEMRTFRIAGGESIQLPMSQAGAKSVENADVKIEVTGFMLDGANKEIIYTFGFTEKKTERPTSVKVEDVTGTEAELLVVDSSPKLSDKGYWKGNAAPRKKGHAGLAWLTESGDTTKVFRFTITTADGRTLMMHQASVWAAGSKPLIRGLLGYQS